MRGDTLSFSVSYHCNLACGHCSVSSGPERSRRSLSAARMIEMIDGMVERLPLRRVVFTGGEPTLFPDAVLPVVEHCRDLELPSRIVTNASWASPGGRAEQTATKYAAAGLAEFALSVSPYHLELQPWGRYVEATRAALANDIAVQFLLVESATSDFTEEALRSKLIGAGIDVSDARLEILASGVMPAGRAHRLGEAEFQKIPLGEVPDEGCGMVLNPIVVTPEGRIKACCGIPYAEIPELELGRLEDGATPASVLDEARQSPLLRWIHSVGPWRILSVLDPERYGPDVPVVGRHICQGCNLLFGDAENRRRLHEYLERRGDRILFHECLESYEPREEAILA